MKRQYFCSFSSFPVCLMSRFFSTSFPSWLAEGPVGIFKGLKCFFTVVYFLSIFFVSVGTSSARWCRVLMMDLQCCSGRCESSWEPFSEALVCSFPRCWVCFLPQGSAIPYFFVAPEELWWFLFSFCFFPCTNCW